MFENCKFIIQNEDESRAAQAALFNLGYNWCGKQDYKDTTRFYDYPNVIFAGEEGNWSLSYSGITYAECQDTSHRFVRLEHLLATNSVLSVQGMLDKMEADGDVVLKCADALAWIAHTGNACPVAEGMMVDVQYRDGQVVLNVPAMLLEGCDRDASPAYWKDENGCNDIVAWRLAAQEADDALVYPAPCDTGELLGVLPTTGAGCKDTNPKTSAGDTKVPLHLFPSTAIAAGAMAFHEGSCKYGKQNWRVAGVRYSVYQAALLRHVMSAWEGETVDLESGIPHLAKALACIAILIDAQAAGTLTDDRCVKGGYEKLITTLTPQVIELSEKHAGKNPRHYSILDNCELE